MSAMAYRLLVPVRLSGNPSQQRRTTLKSLSSPSIPMLNQTRPAKNSRTSRFQAGVALRTHPLRQNENCWGGSASVASWQAPPLDQGGGAGLRERINFLTGIALASPLSSP